MADVSERGFVKGAQWLVWRFESDATLADAMQVGPCQPATGQAGWRGAATPCLAGPCEPPRLGSHVCRNT